jgi:protein arginine kinase activator
MLCCICKEREATVHYTKIAEGKMQKVDVCEDCYKTKGASDPAAFSLADLLLGLGASQELEQSAGGGELKCSRCGFTQADFKKTGRLGCAGCYQTFSEGLEVLLKSMHKGTRHTGKVPENLRQGRELSEHMKNLQRKLAKAITEENFELAAQLRDEINNAASRLKNPAAT